MMERTADCIGKIEKLNDQDRSRLTLAIESSCDETAAAVVADGRKVLSNIISSQIDVHKAYGGVVPEIASRHHLENINHVAEKALDDAGIDMNDIDFFSVTSGPGLVGALVIGVATAKAFALAMDKPLVAVHHIHGHIAANYIEYPDLEPPFIALIVSGGHTNIVNVTGYGQVESLGQTRDDAVGEAFDKVARVLGLPYPGGPAIDQAAHEGDKEAVYFKRALLGDATYDFSFSGIKTQVLNHVNSEKQAGHRVNVPDIAAAFQEAVLDVVCEKAIMAAINNDSDKLVVCGGVAANTRLREKLETATATKGIRLCIPAPKLCTDNAAMIGAAGYYEFIAGRTQDLSLDATAQVAL